jgi:spore coat polysaccharide biosynthesis protein SpsF (cytidylyltransferase family)
MSVERVSPLSIGFVVQARMSSSRLPGKMAMPFGNHSSLLGHIVSNLRLSFPDYNVCVATSVCPSDDKIEALSEEIGVQCFRGALNNVAERLIAAASEISIDYVVRVCGDNPFISSKLVRILLDAFQMHSGDYDYYTHTIEGKPAIVAGGGFFVEIFSVHRLIELLPDLSDYEKEHVTPLFYTPFNSRTLALPCDTQGLDGFRLSVDTEEDYLLCKEICESLDGKTTDLEVVIDSLTNNQRQRMKLEH